MLAYLQCILVWWQIQIAAVQTKDAQTVHSIIRRAVFVSECQTKQTICDEILVISNVDMMHLAKGQIESEGLVGRYLLEPVGRNTAPALGLGALMDQPDDIIMMTTSDHVITKTDAFEQAVASAVALARQDYIVTRLSPLIPRQGLDTSNTKAKMSFS